MERRDCGSVIKQMLAIIPEEKSKLIDALKWNLEDSKYKAPEESLQWQRTMKTLQTYIEKPKEDWEWKVIGIFTMKSKKLLMKQMEEY